MKLWNCEECRLEVEGKQPPLKCPECDASSYRFALIKDTDPNPLDKVLDMLDEYEDGCEPRSLIDSGE